MQALGKTGADANGAAAATCYTNQSACSSTCSDLVVKYEALANNCDSCSSLSIYENAAQTLLSLKSSCDRLSAQVQILNQQALAANASGANGDICQQVTQAQMQPQSAGNIPSESASNTNNPSDPYGCQANPSGAACLGCKANSNSAYCKAILGGQGVETGKAGFQTSSQERTKKSAEDFNVFPMSYSNSNSQQVKANAHVAANTIPNNSDSPPPQGHGSGLEGLGSTKPAAATAGHNTNVLGDSTRSGGGYSYTNGSQDLGAPNRSPSSSHTQAKGFNLGERLLSWVKEKLPSGWFKSGSTKRQMNMRPCTNGNLQGCEYPQSMGSLDGDVLPVSERRTSYGYVFAVSAFVMFGTFGGIWSFMNWPFVKGIFVTLASRLLWFHPAAGTKRPNRRSRDIPVSNNRRAS